MSYHVTLCHAMLRRSRPGTPCPWRSSGIYIYIYIYIYIGVCVYIYLYLSLSLYIYICIHDDDDDDDDDDTNNDNKGGRASGTASRRPTRFLWPFDYIFVSLEFHNSGLN